MRWGGAKSEVEGGYEKSALAGRRLCEQEMESRSMIEKVRGWFQLLSLALLLGACSFVPGNARGGDYLPGGVQFYSAGSAQNKEYFTQNVNRVQYDYSIFSNQRTWGDSGTTIAPSTLNMLQTYYPLHVRWELKDGRQFIAENIDVRSLMREYFKAHDIQMQWQREGRARAEGDYDPSLVYEIRDDEVIVKWLLSVNRTPLSRRAKELPKIEYQQYPVGTIKGKPTAGIDFEKRWEFNRNK